MFDHVLFLIFSAQKSSISIKPKVLRIFFFLVSNSQFKSNPKKKKLEPTFWCEFRLLTDRSNLDSRSQQTLWTCDIKFYSSKNQILVIL